MSSASVPYRDSRLLSAIPDNVLAETGVRPELLEFSAGAVVFEEMDPPDGCYIVESGSVRISKTGENGHQETLDFIGPGGFFGELSLYNPAPRSARATAAVSSRLARLDRDAFDRLRHAAPLQMTAVLADVSIERLRATDAYLIERLRDGGRLREVGATLGTVAHNVRSPLATIQNAADLLLDMMSIGDVEREQVIRIAEIIRRTTALALESSDQLLARVRGEAQADRVLVYADQLLAAAITQVDGMLSSRGILFDSEVRHNALLQVESAEVASALANLIRNAVESIAGEGGTVRAIVDRGKNGVQIAVSDNGCGIDPAHLGRVFEFRFTQGKAGGTGLGLAHVKDVCDRHGGSVEVESLPGVGTTFRMLLPAAD